MLPSDFAVGALRYLDQVPGRERENRIVLEVHFGSLPSSFAVLDTGSPYCILSPNEANLLGIDYRTKATEQPLLNIRGYKVPGWMVRLPIRLEPDQGDEIEIDASVFIPNLSGNVVWAFPNFLGLTGFLERIRFAVDPANNLFYYGHT